MDADDVQNINIDSFIHEGFGLVVPSRFYRVRRFHAARIHAEAFWRRQNSNLPRLSFYRSVHLHQNQRQFVRRSVQPTHVLVSGMFKVELAP